MKSETELDQVISAEDFDRLLEKPKAIRALEDVGVDVVGLVELREFIFRDSVEGLSFPDFMDTDLPPAGLCVSLSLSLSLYIHK